MENTNFILLFFLILLNINLDFGQEINIVNPVFIPVMEGGWVDIIVNFNQSMINDDIKNLTLVHSSGTKFTLNGRASDDEDDINKLFFYFNYDSDFLNNENMKTGYYQIYYGIHNITFKDKILIYKSEIILIEPTIRYFLDSGSGKINALFEFLKGDISKDQINRIEYYNDENPNNKNNILISDYNVNEKGTALNISFDRADNVAKFSFSLYPTTDENTNNPITFHIYFQDFDVKYEAVYFNQSVNSAIGFLKLEFKPNQFRESSFSLEYTNEENYVDIQKKNFTELGNWKYMYYFNINTKPLPGKIIIKYNHNNNNQERPIYMITYQTDADKCYLHGEIKTFEITFHKINEMQFTHSVYFNYLNGALFTPNDQNTNSPRYSYSLQMLASGTYNLYSRISTLNSEENNPIDNSTLMVRISKDPKLSNSTEDVIFTRFNEAQYMYFSMSGADYINEIFLYNNDRTITLYKDQNCSIDNTMFSCKFTDLSDSYIGNYSVNYTSDCNNKKLRVGGKRIRIERGIFLREINPKYCYLDTIDTTEVTLTFTYNIDSNINISFCKVKDNTCSEQKINSVPNTPTTWIIISNLFNLTNDTYYIKTTIKNLTIENKQIKFKVLNRHKFNFNHHYFVKNDSIPENKLHITKLFQDIDKSICVIQSSDQKNLSQNTDCNNFTYEINTASSNMITFRYLDRDIDVFIPINDSIYVVDNINNLLSFDWKNCYYYNFSLLNSFRPNYNFIQKIFLVNNASGEKKIEFNKVENNDNNNNIFELNEANQNEIIGNELDLFISEGTIDTKTYLYKSKITLSYINVPEYVMYPNRIISFTNISCNLCDSTFKMINNSNNFNIENGCNYYQNNSMTIQGNNIYVDGFKYYKYSVNDKIIKSYNNSTLLTFVSNNLNRSAFGVSYTDENDTFLKVDIENRNREFYFKLINDLVIHKLINGKIYDTIILNRTHNLNINEPFYNLSFFIEKGNYDLYIDYITRTKQNWENVENNTLYYFFNR